MFPYCSVMLTTDSILLQALGVFGLCQIHAFVDYVRSRLSREQFDVLFRFVVLVAGVISLAAFGVATALGSILTQCANLLND